MTFTYVPANDIGKVRRYVGDTVEAEAELTDEEIQAWLDDNANDHVTAAIQILRGLANKWAKRATFKTGNEQINLSDVAKAYLASAQELEATQGQTSVLSNTNVGRMADADRYRVPLNRVYNHDYP